MCCEQECHVRNVRLQLSHSKVIVATAEGENVTAEEMASSSVRAGLAALNRANELDRTARKESRGGKVQTDY